MAVVQLPADFMPREFSLVPLVNQRVHSSPFGGSDQVVDMLNDRWTASMTMPDGGNDDGAAIEAFIGAMRGMTNTVLLWHFRRPVPRGSMRGAPSAWGTGAGASELKITTFTTGATLKAGDMIGVGGLLLQIAADVGSDAGGIITAPLVNRLRRSVAAGAPITWNKPTAPFRMVSKSAVTYVPGYAPGASFDFVEAVP